MGTPSGLNNEEKKNIEESDGWGEVKIKEDFEPSTTTTSSSTTRETTTEEEKEETTTTASQEPEDKKEKGEKEEKKESSWWDMEQYMGKHERSGACPREMAWTVVVSISFLYQLLPL